MKFLILFAVLSAFTTLSCDPPQDSVGACCTIGGHCRLEDGESYCGIEQGDFLGYGTTCSPNPCLGACCDNETGACTQKSKDDCAPGGTYTSYQVACDPNPCEDPVGACCAADGECEMIAQGVCEVLGDTYMGDGTECSFDLCEGACCDIANGDCNQEVQADCEPNGVFMGVGAACQVDTCEVELGACCVEEGICQSASAAGCEALSGTFMEGEDCQPNPCPTVGACCHFDGECRIETESDCEAFGGAFMGIDSECSPNPCAGACCDVATYACSQKTVEDCSPGAHMGYNVPCVPDPCEGPFGACCTAGDVCLVASESRCTDLDGLFMLDTSCDPNPCPTAGACCESGYGECRVLTQSDCEGFGETYMGLDTECSPNPCLGACCNISSGECSQTRREACSPNGAFIGYLVPCIPDPCDVPSGACCTGTDTCQGTSEAGCLDLDGLFLLDQDCDPNPCLTAGACCESGYGECRVLSQSDCEGFGETYMGLDTECSPNPCLGACCNISSGECSQTRREACSPNGAFIGYLVPCSPDPCDVPRGACCTAGDVCQGTSEAGCLDLDGLFMVDQVCDPNPCPTAGACCESSQGECRVLTESDCEGFGETYMGLDTECSPNPCLGACCDNATQECSQVSPDDCRPAGSYKGFNIPCIPDPCEPMGACCAADDSCTSSTEAACTGTFMQGETCGDPNPCAPAKQWYNSCLLDTGLWDEYPVDLQVDINQDGSALVIWQETGSVIAVSRAPDDSCTSPAAIEPYTDYAYNLQVAIDAAGNGMAMWNQMVVTGEHLRVLVSRYTPVGGWGPATVLDSSTEDIWMPDLSMNDAGDACVVWDQEDFVVASVFSSGSSSWSGPLGIWGDGERIQDVKCAMDGTGHFFVGWAHIPTDLAMDTMVTRCTLAGACDGPAIPDLSGLEDSFISDLAASENGTAIVTWDQFLWPTDLDTLETVWVSRYDGGWQTATMLSAHVAGKGWGAKTSLDAAGNAVVYWIYYHPLGMDPRHLYAARYDSTAGSWVNQGLLQGNATDDLYYHQGAISSSSEGCVAWLQNNIDVVGSIWFPDDTQDQSITWQSNSGVGPAVAMAIDCIAATVYMNAVRLHVWGVRPW